MEVYGVKPKKFTKEWWGYFWYYYKLHTLGGAFAAFLIIVTCVQCATQTKYDLQIDFISEYGLMTEREQALEELACANIEDVTENGKTEAFVMNLDMSNTQDAQMVQAMQTKLMLEMGFSEGYVFILTKQYADMMVEQGALEPASVWTEEYSGDGYTVSLAGCTALADLGIDAEAQELYIGVNSLREKNREDELEIARHENGIRFARYLISRR